MEYLKVVDGYEYFRCLDCSLISLHEDVIRQIDAGGNPVVYDESYWARELPSARERSYGAALARMAEAFYYCRIPIRRFLDVGTGPGYFLDAVAKYLPYSADVFYGIEKYPPPLEYRSKSRNYVVGDLSALGHLRFDAGICVEVAEHLTPRMLAGLLLDLASVSNKGAFYLFNTGMPDFVLREDKAYLDPCGRGHIASYSLRAVDIIARPLGFSTLAISGKTWAFGLEYQATRSGEDLQDRIWSPVGHNMRILADEDMGSALKILGLETSRAYR